MPIWTDSFLDQLSTDAETEILKATPALYHRFYLSLTAGTAVYTLPAKVRSILRITWRGIEVLPKSWDFITSLYNGSAVVDGDSVNITQSLPAYFALHPTNVYDIQFYPSPNETSSNGTDPYSVSRSNPECIVSCWRNVDLSVASASLPLYIDRRTRKAYVLWKAFEKEGAGQNLSAAKYYKAKFAFLISQFKSINETAFIAKQYSIEDSAPSYRTPRPSLPSNFERVEY